MVTIFASKKSRKFNAILKMAKELTQQLSWVPECVNGMDRIVEFFRIISPVQDQFLATINGGLNLKNKKKQKFIDEFSKFLRGAGRHIYGWNRTKTGEIPTSFNVYINMIVPYDELFITRRVADHLSRRKNPVGEVDDFVKKESRGKFNETGLIEKDFVNPFMQSHYQSLISIMENFEANN